MEKDCQYLSWENAPIGPLLGHAAHLARERMDVRLARYDVTPAQTHVLLYLGEQSGPTPQRDVVEHLRVKPPTANGILDRLEKALSWSAVSVRISLCSTFGNAQPCVGFFVTRRCSMARLYAEPII